MLNPLPPFDHNLVLPPHFGDPVQFDELSPYPCTRLHRCKRVGTTPERRATLGRSLDFRERLRAEGLLNGLQWLDGSFLEDVETSRNHSVGGKIDENLTEEQVIDLNKRL